MILTFSQIRSRAVFFSEKYRYLYAGIGENTAGILVNMFAMVLVERHLDHEGLGLFSYLLSLYYIAGFFAEFGVPGFVRHAYVRYAARSEVSGVIFSRDALAAVSLAGFLGFLLLAATAVFDTRLTRVEERALVYLMTGITLPLRGINRVLYSLFHASGRHERASFFRVLKKGIYLAAVCLLLLLKASPSLMVLAFFISELLVLPVLLREVFLPGVQGKPSMNAAIAILKKSFDYLFLEDALGLIFYLDFLVLGIFVSSADLGIYAEAAVFARFFLLLPAGVSPVMEHLFIMLYEKKRVTALRAAVRKYTSILFFLQALLALYVLFFFETMLNLIFQTHGEEFVSFRVFVTFLPGLLFYPVIMTLESALEASGRAGTLKGCAVKTIVVNLALNLYLIPYGKIYGAAAATMISMILFFLLLERSGFFPGVKEGAENGVRIYDFRTQSGYLASVSLLYLVYKTVLFLNMSPWVLAPVLPLVLLTLFYMTGFFDFN